MKVVDKQAGMLAIKCMHPSNLQAFTENIFENIKYGLLTKLFQH